jgi:hypothetical protein
MPIFSSMFTNLAYPLVSLANLRHQCSQLLVNSSLGSISLYLNCRFLMVQLQNRARDHLNQIHNGQHGTQPFAINFDTPLRE